MRRHHKNRTPHFVIVFSLSILAIVAGSMAFNYPVAVTNAEKVEDTQSPVSDTSERKGKHVVVYLSEMKVELRDGKEVLKTLPMLSWELLRDHRGRI